jgi:uridine kinase
VNSAGAGYTSVGQVASSPDDILTTVLRVPARAGCCARLIAISGIDGSGKGYVSALLKTKLENNRLCVALIGVDGWLNLPHIRFGAENPSQHFYTYAFRFEEMFATLIDPLVRTGSVRLVADYTEETSTSHRKAFYWYESVDVVLLEGIFLFKREYCGRYDFRIWIECSFETALERALARSQEGLPPEETITAYQNIYFPAEHVHLERDNPRGCADLLYVNDARSARLG